jgi:hypothetical protein
VFSFQSLVVTTLVFDVSYSLALNAFEQMLRVSRCALRRRACALRAPALCHLSSTLFRASSSASSAAVYGVRRLSTASPPTPKPAAAAAVGSRTPTPNASAAAAAPSVKDVAQFELRVGWVCEVVKHPKADTLYVCICCGVGCG